MARESVSLDILCCADCDQVLGGVRPAREAGGHLDVEAIVDLFDAAMSAEDEGQSRTLRSKAMGELELQLRAVGGGDMQFFERLFTALMERHRQRRSEQP